ncbi:WXG100-like domain-containing protein [Streptomyces anandii]|uniref:WXG100-like domain-containing protein n=1 Tax=Streptomyces anandii TaxID=285454 RepID=UPI0037A2F913
MSAADKAKEIVQDVTGMWWPDADEDGLRDAAKAWRDFADDVEDVLVAANKSARGIIEHNKGEAISAFDDPFWRRYYHDGHGWLKDMADGARDMAKALDQYADAVHATVKRLEHELEIVGATIVAGTALAIFTAGISEAAAAAATAGIVDLAATLGVTVSTEIATIAGTTLATASIAGVESVTVDLAVAQPMKIASGVQGGFSLDEASDSALTGMVFGGALGAGTRGVEAAVGAGGVRNLFFGVGTDLEGLSTVPTPRFNDEWLTGARRRPRDILDDPAQTRWAEAAYDDFLKNPHDIQAISRNTQGVPRANGSTGFSEEEIAAIKKHVFDTEHPIEDYETGQVVIRKFDADAEIADAWIRLRSGNALPEDHVLLEHELTELAYLREHPGATYQEAHRVANETYNWQSKVPLNKREDFESEW